MKPMTVENEGAETISLTQPLTLALSGGGMRAAIYQLGILVFLAEQNRLKDVREIVSVSGGSIVAAHFLKYWPRAVNSLDGFRDIAAELLVISRSNIRNRVIIPWLWSRLVPWSWFFQTRGRTGRLQAEYHRVYGSTTLGDLSDGRPRIAIVATDGIRQERVAFTASQILRWRVQEDDGQSIPATILSKGVELSLAVAASSCFPPVFPRLHLTYEDLGITFGEFKEELHLNDGGVVSNLGLEVLVALRKLDWTKSALILVADAERRLAVKPKDSPFTDVNATLAAMGKAARECAKREFGNMGIPIPFSDRVESKDGLAFRTQTALFDYRTDLDCPTWQEIHGLMIHGAMVARQATDGRLESVSSETLKQTIATIIAEAGGPKSLSMPVETDFRHSGKRPLQRVLSHVAAIIILIAAILAGIGYGAVRLVMGFTHLGAGDVEGPNNRQPNEYGNFHDEPVQPETLPNPSLEPDFPRSAQVKDADSRSLSNVLLLYHNHSRNPLRLLLFDCSQYYESRASNSEPFLRSCFKELPFSESGEPHRYGKFRPTSNWYGVYVCKLGGQHFTLVGFRDFTLAKVWRIDVHEQQGELRGEFAGE